MPKPNQTMLDKLAETFKSMGKTAPFREMKLHGEFTDPMIKAQVNQKLAGNKIFKLDPSWPTPERVKYQRGLKNQFWKRENQLRQEQDEAMDRVDDLQQSYERDFEDARDRLAGAVSDEIQGWDPEEISPYDVDGYESPNYSLEDYWEGEYPLSEYTDLMAEADDKFNEASGRFMDWKNSGMRELQLNSPRYRNYQRAMRQREDNARLGRLNAAIMNLYRQGYSMPEIREILRNQRIR